jgi:hypothetical protein
MDARLLPKVEVHFGIYGKFDPEDVTRILETAPSRTAREGQRVRTHGQVIPIEDSWDLVSESVDTLESTGAVVAVVRQLKPLAAALERVRLLYPEVRTELTLVAYIPHPHEAAPDLYLEPAVLRELAELGINFVLDYWLLGPEDKT